MGVTLVNRNIFKSSCREANHSQYHLKAEEMKIESIK
jgi:hypothetical protein